MVKRNPNLTKLSSGYLFPVINKKRAEYLQKHPNAKIISLGIGDTTLPIPEYITEAISDFSKGLSTLEGYSGYGSVQGSELLRKKIAEVVYGNIVDADDIFISDGSKCDLGRMQVLFGGGASIAIQDPAYPVYVDTGVILGQTGLVDAETKCYEGITYMSCTPENNFFPNLEETPRTDIIYFTSPNNPTGAVATKKQLEALVAFAKKNRSLIVFDAAYSEFIRDPSLPKTIYEIEGADEVAIELGSFSKNAGFTGVRLGWSVVPTKLRFEEGSSVKDDWSRIVATFFNGASNLSQEGAYAALHPTGQKEIKGIVDYYLENAKMIKSALDELGFETYGGENAPYIWARTPGKLSWEIFEELLNNVQIVCTPGVGFGPVGEGFVRFSPFGRRHDVIEAIDRLKSYYAAKI